MPPKSFLLHPARLGRVTAVLLLPVLLLGLFITHLGAEPTAVTATIAVTTTQDEIDDNEFCSIREAIETANNNSEIGGCTINGTGAFVINIPAGNYFLSRGTYDEEANQGGDFDVISSVTVQGAGADNTKIDANALDRIFDIDPTDTVTIEVTIADVTIQNGQPISRTDGGGIRNNDDTVTVLRAIVADNRLTGAYVEDDFQTASGGGIYSGGGAFSSAGTLNVIDSVIEDNSTTYGSGGGIYNDGGVLNISNSTIHGNLANIIQGTSSGGGLSNSGGTVNIIGSAILDNESDGHSGGIVNFFSSAITNIANSTVSGNRTDGSGGGIRNYGEMWLTNVTISNNTADNDAQFGGWGGGIRNNGTLHMKGVIVFGNIDKDSPDEPDQPGEPEDVFPDIRDTGTLTSEGYNLIGIITGTTTITSGINGDQVGIDPNLDPLTIGLIGSPSYHPLPLLSPALDQIPAINCTYISTGTNSLFTAGAPNLSDQAGNTRPNPATILCDVGAHEPPYRYIYLPATLKTAE